MNGISSSGWGGLTVAQPPVSSTVPSTRPPTAGDDPVDVEHKFGLRLLRFILIWWRTCRTGLPLTYSCATFLDAVEIDVLESHRLQ